ncbi:hypothetical protein BJX64DRAFT_277688 [Aspergillus heterothallicus]
MFEAQFETVGKLLGDKNQRKDCQVLLAPTMNLSRSPWVGENLKVLEKTLYLIGIMANATIDKRTLREVYMKPFAMAVQDSTPWTAMVSYPKINGLHADLSPEILPRLLRTELQCPPCGGVRRGWHLLDAIQERRLGESKHVDPAVRRVLQLLERTPLKLRKVAIIGSNARKPTAVGAGSAAVNPFYAVSPTTEITYQPGIPETLRPPLLGELLMATFFAGHDFQGPAVGTSSWKDSSIYLFSDGDAPGMVTPRHSGHYTWSLANTGKAKLFLDNSYWSTTPSGRRRLGGRAYQLRVDKVVMLPLMHAFDNTLFPRVSSIRIGLALQRDESSMMEQAIASAREAEVAVVVVGHNKDSEGEGGDRAHMQLPGCTEKLSGSALG